MIVKIFDRNEEYRAEAEIFNFRHLHEINRLDVLTGYTLEPIDKGEKILYQHKTGKWYEFIVDAPEIIHEEGVQYHFTAINSLVEIDGDWIEDKRPSTLSAAVVSILEPTRWTMGNVTNKPNIGLTFYRVTAREALDILLENYPVEFQTRIEVGTSGVVTRTLDVLDRIGGDYGKRFVYNRDLTSVKRTYRQGKVVTALYGFGKGEEVGDGFGRRIDFSSVNNGKAYVYNPDILAQYGRLENGVRKHVFDSVVYDDVEDKNKLLQLTQDEYAKRCRPQVSYEGTVLDLGLEHEQVGIGDTVKVIDGNHRFETRVNYLLENEDFQNEVRLANYIMNITDTNNALIKKVGELATNAGVWDKAQKIADGSYMDGLIDKLNDQANASGGWTFIQEGEGILTINAPTEATATEAVNIVGGTVRVASQKNPNGSWKWRTFITGDQVAADMISTGILKGGKVHWDLDTGVLYIGDSLETANLYWDGSSLNLNVNELKIQSKDVATKEDVDTKANAVDVYTKTEMETQFTIRDGEISSTISSEVSEQIEEIGLGRLVNEQQTKIQQNKDEIALRAKQSDFDNLQVGSRNLYQDTLNPIGIIRAPATWASGYPKKVAVPEWDATDAWRFRTNSAGPADKIKAYIRILDNFIFLNGNDFILSAYIKNNMGKNVIIGSNRYGTQTLGPYESKKMIFKGNTSESLWLLLQFIGETVNDIIDVTVWHIHAERANVPSEWNLPSETLIDRIQEAEQKVTPSAITGTISSATNSNGEPLFAKTSEVEQTVNSWVAKFSDSGGANLLLKTNKPAYFSSDNGNEQQANEYTDHYGTYQRVIVPNNGNIYTYYDLAEPLIGGKTYTISYEIYSGIDGRPYQFVYDAGDGVKRENIAQPYYVFKKHTHTFVQSETKSDFVLIGWDGFLAGQSFSIKNIQLEAGSFSTPWTLSSRELYAGITSIDKDGVKVGRDNETIETNVGFDGLRVNDGSTEIASFLGSGAVISNLQAETITGNVVNTLDETLTLNVGTGNGYYANVSEVLNALGNKKYLKSGVYLRINIYGVLNEDISISGFMGGGTISINLYGRINGSINTWGNSCRVYITGMTSNNVIAYSGEVFNSYGDSFVIIDNIVTDSKNSANSICFQARDGSSVVVRNCDMVNCVTGAKAINGAKMQLINNRGNCSGYGYIANALMWAVGTAPNGASGTSARDTYGFLNIVGTLTATNSTYSPPSTVTTTETRTFNQTDIYTYSVKYGARSAHYGKAAAQNRRDTSMTQMKGKVVFGSSVYNFIAGRDSGTSVTVKLRLRRQNSTHGASASVAPTPEWTGAPSFGGATRGNWTAWVTIPYTLFTSSGYTFSFYNGTTGSSYAIWDRAEVRITRTITQ